MHLNNYRLTLHEIRLIWYHQKLAFWHEKVLQGGDKNIWVFYSCMFSQVRLSLCSTSICQNCCGTNQLLTVRHNTILIGYNNTCLLRHKIFSPFHDVIINFDCIYPRGRHTSMEWKYFVCEKCGYLCKSDVYMACTLWMWNRPRDSVRSTECVCVCGGGGGGVCTPCGQMAFKAQVCW
jgi:hypothetical protein